MRHVLCWLLFAALTSGCTSYGPSFALDDYEAMEGQMAKFETEHALDQLGKMPRRKGALPSAERQGEFAEALETWRCANTNNPGSTRQLLLKTPRGSYVRVAGSLGSSYQGTFVGVEGSKAVFANCFYRLPVKCFDGLVHAQTTFAPRIEAEIAGLSHMDVLAVPHRADTTVIADEVVTEIEFCSGRRRRISVPDPLPWPVDGTEPELAALEEQSRRSPLILLTAERGSLVGLRDSSGRWFEGSLVSTDEAAVRLQDSISVEPKYGPSGQLVQKVSNCWSQEVATASVQEAMILGPPPADFQQSIEERDRGDLCVERFHFRSGSRRPLDYEIADPPPELTENDDETVKPFGAS